MKIVLVYINSYVSYNKCKCNYISHISHISHISISCRLYYFLYPVLYNTWDIIQFPTISNLRSHIAWPFKQKLRPRNVPQPSGQSPQWGVHPQLLKQEWLSGKLLFLFFDFHFWRSRSEKTKQSVLKVQCASDGRITLSFDRNPASQLQSTLPRLLDIYNSSKGTHKSELWEPQSTVSKLTTTETSYEEVLLIQFITIDKDPGKKIPPQHNRVLPQRPSPTKIET